VASGQRVDYIWVSSVGHNPERQLDGVEALIRERQAEGIALAKARGAYKGRQKSLTLAKLSRAAAGEPKASLAREFGTSRQALYQYLRPAKSAPSAGPG
jgi:DNA invertase Pin-like site-specific DNA recombinase